MIHFPCSRKWLLGLVFLLAGCGEEEFQDLQEFVNKSGEGLRGKIEAPPEVKPYEPFSYDNSAGLPDPFKPRKPEKKKAGSGVSLSPELENHKKEELEDFPLESLKMVGFVNIHGIANAVIRCPDGKIRHAKTGNYMGQNYGHILSITETEIKLKEMVQDSTGDWTERTSSLQLTE